MKKKKNFSVTLHYPSLILRAASSFRMNNKIPMFCRAMSLYLVHPEMCKLVRSIKNSKFFDWTRICIQESNTCMGLGSVTNYQLVNGYSQLLTGVYMKL